jgi:hypothetical protein
MEICVTRFNVSTFNENRAWIIKNNNSIGCIYGTPVKISITLDPDSRLLVLEMNNTNNTIEGIGIIKNKDAIIRKLINCSKKSIYYLGINKCFPDDM